MRTRPNKGAAGKRGIRVLFHTGRPCPALPELGCSLYAPNAFILSSSPPPSALTRSLQEALQAMGYVVRVPRCAGEFRRISKLR